MTNKRVFNIIFISEVVAMVFAMAVFRLIEPKMLAALFAGSMFVLLGLEILAFGVFRPELRKTFTFPLGMLHLFVMAIPLLAMRVYHYGTDFSAIHVWGLPGPVFHHVSEFLYLGLMAGTAADRIRLRLREIREGRIGAEPKASGVQADR
jgi:hypothetical protein